LEKRGNIRVRICSNLMPSAKLRTPTIFAIRMIDRSQREPAWR
jgi:hypothetical protein